MEVGDEAAGSQELTAVLDTEEAGGIAIRGGALRLVGYGVSVLLSVAGVAAMTRHLGSADYGRFTVVQAVVGIAAGATEAGLVSIGIREYAVREGHARDSMLRNLQGLRVALGVAGVSAALVFGLLAGYDGVMLLGIVLTGVAVVVTAFQAAVGIPLSTGLRWGTATALDLVRQVAQVALILALVLAGTGLLPFFLIQIPASVVVLFMTVHYVRGAAPITPAFDWTQWKGLLRLVAPFAAATAVGTIYVFVAAVLMELVATPDEVGWFSASFRVFTVLSGIPLLLVGAVFPILARASRDNERRHGYATSRLLETAVVGGVLLVIGTALLAPIAIDVVAGPQFHESVSVLRIQALALFGSCLLVATTHVLISLARYREILVVSALALVVSATLVLSLAPSLGAQGGAAATVGGETVAGLLGVWFVIHATPGARLQARRVIAALIGALPAAVVFVLGVPAIPAAVVATLAFAVIVYALGGVPGEILDLVPARFRPKVR